MNLTANSLNLSRFQSRSFVPKDVDLQNPQTVELLYQRLLERPMASTKDLERWLLERSELDAVLSQEGAIVYILMTCQTDDAKRTDAYKKFIETIEPIIKQMDDKLNKRFFEAAKEHPLDKKRYGVYEREIKNELELFVEENVALSTQEELLGQEYQAICAAMTISFKGKEHTLPQMGKYLVELDRGLREKAWLKSAHRRLKDKGRLDDLFGRMLKLRTQMAKNAGFDNYRDYKFKALGRFDYTPQDCKHYHQTIERIVVPLMGRILEERKKKMKLDALRPWDLAVDPAAQPPLKPFERVEELVEGCKKIFSDMDEELGAHFALMADEGLLDLESRKGKAPGGYQHALHEARLPFIFMNAVGLDSDMRTLLHEAGHAFHSLACRHDPLFDYRHGPMEFNEVASMAMEILPDERISVFYNEEETDRSISDHFKDVVFTLVWVAIVDCFQHWLYENPDHTPQQRSQEWIRIRWRFGSGYVDWQGLESEHEYLWHRQLHIFEVPFYYIEYGIAQLGALQLWLTAKKDPKKALGHYKKALALGGSRTIPELYEAAGIRFDFSEKTIAPLMEAVMEEWRKKT
ncbi:MAG TPA: M3 family oligoendopeptidase [Candidatus Omnitrophota bacterium]|nr:M3 family oligoendopeptidase [Candidatus Omnitrophota bacterium]